jgi:hypothetical protein
MLSQRWIERSALDEKIAREAGKQLPSRDPLDSLRVSSAHDPPGDTDLLEDL